MSTTERPLTTAQQPIKAMLVNNEPFQYAHLIKFERPSRPDALSGLVSTAAQRYTYLTDASINVSFDDGSTDLQGTLNGSQTYLANKVLSVGAVQEQTKATTSNTSIVLDGNAIGAYIEATVTISGTGPWDIALSAPINIDDFLAAGFREGDKITVNGISVNIQSFRANNVVRVSKIDSVLTAGTITDCPFTLSSEEIISILLNKNDAEYASFINREVYIYRAYFQNGVIVGAPLPLFKGIIQNVSFEDSETAIKVTWGLSSHWGDFAQVKGRITSDSAHRALDANGIPQPTSTLKPGYAYDKGFNHAEMSVNLLSKYSVMVEKIDVSSKKGFLGIGASVKTKKQMVPEDRNTVLDFQLNAKAIPIIYGVRIAEGIPIFADTLNNDSSTVYAAVALSEGEIGGIYDIYVDGLSMICNDKADFDVRSASGITTAGVTRTTDQNSSVQLTCVGRSDRGDVLNGQSSIAALPRFFYDVTGEGNSLYRGNFNYIAEWYARQYSAVSNLSTYNDYGIIDGESISLTTPINFTLDVFTGKPGQSASAALCDIAYAKNFRVQNNYWTGTDTSEYWGPNHKLLDTAYIVGKYKIAEGDTTIPEIKFVVRGKVIDCYNYDYSYLHDEKAGIIAATTISISAGNMTITVPTGHGLIAGQTISLINASNSALNFTSKTISSVTSTTVVVPTTATGSATSGTVVSELSDNFPLGETGIGLYYINASLAEVPLATGLQIIDKWTFMSPDGDINTRFRFDNGTAMETILAYVNGKPSITKFYMKDSVGNKWTMVTHNYNIYGAEYSDTVNRRFVGAAISSPISTPYSTTGFTTAGTSLAINYTTNANMPIEGDPVNATAKFQVLNSDYTPISGGTLFPYAIFVGSAVSSSSLTTYYKYTDYSSEAAGLPTGAILASKNTIKLASTASSVADYYKGYLIEVTRYTTTGKSIVQVAEIIGYDGTNKIATIDTIWDFIPVGTGTSGDSVRIYPKYADGRVSINPAIQLLDYVTSKTYGRGLDPYKDIDLTSWTEAGRKCDTRSDITILSTGNPAALIGDKYNYVVGGNLIWQGIASVDTYSVTVEGTTKYLTTFTDVIGKLTNKWNSWKSWKVGEIIYNSSYEFFTITTAGVIATEPTSSSTQGTTLTTSFAVSKVSGSGSSTITLPTVPATGNPIQTWLNGNKNSGYSLYDSDDINYWRLCGWDEHAQRYVTRNQCNIGIDTSVPLFDNINALLEHFNGILRYTSGKYYLDVEEAAGTIDTTDIRTITTDDIIGKIQLSDEGTRSAFNSLTAAFADPANKFEARNVSFFNSDYLKADRNVPKKGNLSIPGITNYYNTRLLADSFLNKSRFGLSISMTVRYHGILFLAGTVIQVVYPRYNWTSPGKKFRIESVNYQPDGLVDIVAKEYDDSFYSLSNIRKAAGSTTAATTNSGTAIGFMPGKKPGVPSGTLNTTSNKYNQIELSWVNPTDTSISNTYVEIWRSDTNSLASASLVDTVLAVSGTQKYIDRFAPNTSTGGGTIRYYWIRYKVVQ
jgi:hypothetical protein